MPRSGPLPRRRGRRGGIDLVQALFSRVPESAARLVVIIDDAHVLTHPDVLAGLDSLIRGWQPGLRLILAARSDPLLPLHRYRLAGQMHELRAADLAMTPAEIAEVLSAHGVTLEARDFEHPGGADRGMGGGRAAVRHADGGRRVPRRFRLRTGAGSGQHR